VDVNRVSHVQATNFAFFFFASIQLQPIFRGMLRGKPLSEIFRVQAANGIVQFSMLAGVVIFSPYIMNPVGCKL